MNLKWFVSFCQWTYAYYSIHLLFYVYYYRKIHPFDLFFAKRGVLLGIYLCFVNFILGKIHPFCLFFAKRGVLLGNYLCFFNFMLGKIHPFCLFLPKKGVLLKKYLNNHSITVVNFMLNNLCCKTCILVMFFIKV